jgi:uncharacterized membrane protein YdjX (TVP38/TMEM64 family)
MCIILTALVYVFIINPEMLSVEYMAEQLKQHQSMIWAVYIGLSVGRALIMLPSTPFLFLGLALFPEQKLFVLLISMLSLACSTSFFYYVAGSMGWHQYFEEKYPKQMQRIKGWMEGPRVVWLVLFWSFIPITPTDLLAYVAGIVPIRFRTLITGVLFGQLPLMIIYTYLGGLVF